IEDGVIHALDHAGKNAARSLVILISIHTDSVVARPLLLRRLDRAEAGLSCRLIENVRAVADELERLALALVHVVPVAGIGRDDLDVGIGHLGSGAITGLELMNEGYIQAA